MKEDPCQSKRKAESTEGKAKKAKRVDPAEYRRENHIECEVDLPDPIQRFKDAPFDEAVMDAIARAGFPSPTSVQAQTWAIALEGKDVIGIARTGSGKTLAFLLPSVHLTSGKGPKILVLAPTRELAMQIHSECNKFCAVSSACVYGGVPKGPQQAELKARPRVVVATPGRLVDMLDMGAVKLGKVAALVLDEADRMLDMGFEPQIARIMDEVPTERQTFMFTATWPKAIQKAAAKFLKPDAMRVRINVSEELTANTNVSQEFYKLDDSQKPAKLWELLDTLPSDGRAIVFSNTKRRCEQLCKDVWASGYGACAIHGDKTQQERDRNLKEFVDGKAPVMFATDVASRGLDIKGVTHVLNYDMAADVDNYIHRIGRTGRAGSTGRSITFCNEDYDIACSPALVKIAEDAGVEVPEFLKKWTEKAAKVKKNKQWQYKG